MQIGVLGINYKSAEIHIQEMIAKACRKRLARDSEFAEYNHCIILSTCNRTEIYFGGENLAKAHSDLLALLREEVSIPFEHKLYSYFGFDCFLHLAQVTAGLDSLIIAESEIQRQVKTAYQQILLHYNLPSCMHYLFQKCLKLGKQIRSSFPFAQNQMTIAKMLYEISQHLLKEFDSMLFIGNSEINRKVMTFFKRKGVRNITLCTRSLHSAKEMAEKEQLTLLPWDQLSQWQEFPLVICGSNTPQYIINHAPETVHTRLIFDLSVPRTVDPQLSRHPHLTLLNIEELGRLIEHKQQKNLLEINRAEALLCQSVQRSVEIFRQKELRVQVCV